MTFVTTNDTRRLAHWERAFGLMALPVKSAAPRLQWLNDGRQVLAYDLEADRLSSGAFYRFGHFLAARLNCSFTEAVDRIDGWPIEAAGLAAFVDEGETADTAAAQRERSFLRFWRRLVGALAGRVGGADV
ncbi:MAG: hypothetical protein H6661_10195 [Ardenticatenaceae bacterium]|nr:hypothetical protein [Ardenticatenaceae bacterium]